MLVALFEGNTNHMMNISLFFKRMDSESKSKVEEEEVWTIIRECLDLRKSYVYLEMVEPWKKEAVVESSASVMTRDQFHFEPAEATAVSYFILAHGMGFSEVLFCYI